MIVIAGWSGRDSRSRIVAEFSERRRGMATARSANGKTVALVAALLVPAAVALPGSALAFGPLGHRVAGLLAERGLCAAARDEVAVLRGGGSLPQLRRLAHTNR